MEKINKKRMNVSRRLSLSFLAMTFLSVFTALLFVIVKCEASIPSAIFSYLRTIGYLADTVVWFILLCAFSLFIYALQPYLSAGKAIPVRDKMQAGIVFFLLMASAFPLGNYFKEGSLFYKNWMWYFSLWMINLWLAGLSSIILLYCKESILRRIYQAIRRFHTFLQSPQITKTDYLFFTVLLGWTWFSTLLVCFFVFNGVPHIQDEIAQYFQAKIFSLGWMCIKLPADWDFFEYVYLIPDHGRLYSIFPPGHALMMSLGILLESPQFVNPFSSCLILLLVFSLARMWFSLFTARVSVLLLALSPFFIFMGGGFMNHPTCLLFLLVSICFLQAGFDKISLQQSLLFYTASGFFMGMALITRPQTSVAFLPVLFILIFRHYQFLTKKIVVCSFFFLLGVIPPLIFLLTFNAQTTGSPWVMGYTQNFRGNPLGLGQHNWEGRRTGIEVTNTVYHTPLRGFSNFLCNMNGMNYFLFGWPIPSLFFAFLLFCPGLQRGYFEYLCILLILLVGGVYFFFYYQDFCYGPRFFFETMPFWIFLTARGIEESLAWFERFQPSLSEKITALMYGFVILFFICAFCTTWIERIFVMSDNYWGTNGKLVYWTQQRIHEKNALIFVDSFENLAGLYSFQDPRLDRGWVIAKDSGLEENRKLMKIYPGWPAYLIHLDTSTSNATQDLLLDRIPPDPIPKE